MKGAKTGGRQKGTANKVTNEIRNKINHLKVTNEIRNKINHLIENQLETLEDDLKKLSPKERLDIVVKLLPYTIQRLYNTELQIEYINNNKGKTNE